MSQSSFIYTQLNGFKNYYSSQTVLSDINDNPYETIEHFNLI